MTRFDFSWYIRDWRYSILASSVLSGNQLNLDLVREGPSPFYQFFELVFLFLRHV